MEEKNIDKEIYKTRKRIFSQKFDIKNNCIKKIT